MYWKKYAVSGLAVLWVLAAQQANAGRKDIPSYERDYADLTDMFVQRSEPDLARNTMFKHGQLGVLLTSYGREPLFLAYRALVLGRKQLQKQQADTAPRTYDHDEPAGSIEGWLKARGAVTDQSPPRKPDQYRSFEGLAYGKYLNCGNNAFNLAVETLQALRSNAKVSKWAVQEWVAAQDAVFDLCGDADASSPVRPMPSEAGAGTAMYLRQLRQYQIAAANFYDGKYGEAVRRFDAIAADHTHPMRLWANYAAMRAMLRSASLDQTFAVRVREIRNSSDAAADKRTAYKAALAEHRHKMNQSFEQIATRNKAVLADESLAAVHEPARKLLKQAARMLVPDQVYSESSALLARFDKDVDRSGELDDWRQLGDQLFDYGGNADLIAKLRSQHEYFDWIRTIQGCTDNQLSPNFAGRCSQEGEHALEKWQATKGRIWLVAALMTAQQITPQLEPAFAAARQVGPDAMEFLTLRYYMARLLRSAGRRDEAIVLIDQVLAGPSYSVSGGMLRNAASATNLFRQERLTLATNDEQALRYVLRDSAQRLAADGDELLNRRLAADDLLRLARNPAADGALRSQLIVAAWWRADITDNTRTAEAAARLLGDVEPRLREAAATYLKLRDTDERHYLLARAGLVYRISPQVFSIKKDFAGKRKSGAADWWCSFESKDFKARASIERTPAVLLELTADAAARDAELSKLKQIGSAADWLARVAIKRGKTHPNDPYLRSLLDAVVKSENLDCSSADGDNLLNAAKHALEAIKRDRFIYEKRIDAR